MFQPELRARWPRCPYATRKVGSSGPSRGIHEDRRPDRRRCSNGAGATPGGFSGNPPLNTTASSTRRGKEKRDCVSSFLLLIFQGVWGKSSGDSVPTPLVGPAPHPGGSAPDEGLHPPSPLAGLPPRSSRGPCPRRGLRPCLPGGSPGLHPVHEHGRVAGKPGRAGSPGELRWRISVRSLPKSRGRI